jgi:riboflavin kinase/FMN adenylyltransferase
MQVVADALRSADLPRPSVVTIGNYDGIHLGQRHLIERLVEAARELALPAIVITFDPHPLHLLSPGSAPRAIVAPRRKERLLAELGVDALAVVRFDAELAEMTATRFAREFLAGRLGARRIFVGRKFAFGKGREGNVQLLASLGAELGFEVEGVPELELEGAPISSSRIRRAIADGQVELAARLLGRPYSIPGEIVSGDRRGTALGWPTINLLPESELIPLQGVYASRVDFPSFPATYDSVTNIGTRPTLHDDRKRVIESHILDFRKNVYGERVELSFHKRLRDEMLFPSVTALSDQIRRDVESTREYFFDSARSQA